MISQVLKKSDNVQLKVVSQYSQALLCGAVKLVFGLVLVGDSDTDILSQIQSHPLQSKPTTTTETSFVMIQLCQTKCMFANVSHCVIVNVTNSIKNKPI